MCSSMRAAAGVQRRCAMHRARGGGQSEGTRNTESMTGNPAPAGLNTPPGGDAGGPALGGGSCLLYTSDAADDM
eukprot:12043438-Alexandrium_andersonii.AAC.1